MKILIKISKINIIVFLAIILIPLSLFKESIFYSLFNFSFNLTITSLIVLYYFLVLFFIKSNLIKYIASFLVLPFLFIQLLLLYSFVLNKDYTWKELSSKNFKKPLIIWLEKELESLQQEEKDRLILAKQTQEVISDNQISNDEILEAEETWEEETYNRRKYSHEDEYDSYDEYDNYQSDDSDYHYVEGYTRSDGTEVEGYGRGNPDGIEENNIEYMRDNGDQEGLDAAFSSIFN